MADYFCTHCGCRHEPLEHIRHVSNREKLETLAAWLTEDDFTPAEIAAQELIAAAKEMGAHSLDGALSSETLTSLRGLIAPVDTLPKGQDAKLGLAGTEGSAVPEGQTPIPDHSSETPVE